MARLVEVAGAEGPANDSERIAVRQFVGQLPADYFVIPNFVLEERGGQRFEYDVAIVAPHGVYAVELKGWRGSIYGDAVEWSVNGRSRKAPTMLIERKAKVLKSHLIDAQQAWARVRVEAMVVLTDSAVRLDLAEGSGDRVFDMAACMSFLQSPERIKQGKGSIAEFAPEIARSIASIGRVRKTELTFGDYVVIEALEQSDDETIYRARNRDMPAAPEVLLRVVTLSPYLLTEQQKSLRKAQLFREAEALLTMGSHPNVVAARSVFTDDIGRVVLVNDASEGRSLRQRLMNGTPLAVEERLEILIGLARGLRHAHAHGVIHRQVAPQNVLLDDRGTAQLAHFGLAKLLKPEAGTVWESDAVSATMAPYLAPELADADLGPPCPGTDLFGLGCIAYELFAGHAPSLAGGNKDSVTSMDRPDGAPAGLWELLPDLLRVDPAARAGDTAAIVQALESLNRKGRTPPTGPKNEYKPGDLIDGKFEVRSRLGEGGFSSVYRVYHAIEDREFALKIFNAGSFEKLQREIQVLRTINHPHVVKVIWADQTQTKQWYLVSELVDGQPLSDYIGTAKKLGPQEAVRVVLDLLGALEAIHPDEQRIAQLKEAGSNRDLTTDEFNELQSLQQRGVVHRDIKPQNLMLTEQGVVLIDFNIASRAGAPVVTVSGTPPYQPPDANYTRWTVSTDLFATGVVLFELLCGDHPYEDGHPRNDRLPRDPRSMRPELSEEMSEFLLKACAPESEQRFQSAREMRAALASIDVVVSNTASEVHVGLPSRLAALLAASPPNVNPFVREFLSLASQARLTNKNARGLNDLAEVTYVETRLDAELTDAILEGRHQLVVITGNAGDGKTAFIQQVESQALQRGAKRLEQSANGGRLRFMARDVITVYDGSQDEDDKASDEVLHTFFAPFAAQGASDGSVRVAAINEGRLRDFVLGFRDRYPRLVDVLVQLDDAAYRSEDQAIALVNLNWRSVTAGGYESIFSRQVHAVVSGPFWEKCQACDFRARCPIKHNVDTLRDSTAGPVVIERLRRLVDLVRLRQRRHLTMRDIRSLISFLLFRDRTCEEIAEALQSDDPLVVANLAYFQAVGALGQPAGSVVDRSALLLAEADIALVASPVEDRAVALGKLPRRLAVPTRESDHPAELLLEAQRRAGYGYESDAAQSSRILQGLRRLVFFERSDEKWWDMVPYRKLQALEKALEPNAENARQSLGAEIITALSTSEGIDDVTRASQALWLATTDETEVGVKSYKRFAASDFNVRIAAAQRPYVEAAPDHLELIHSPSGIALGVTVDVLEVLERLQEGHVPSLEEARGLLVNLKLFKHRLLALPTSSLVLVAEDGEYEIAGHLDGRVELIEAKK